MGDAQENINWKDKVAEDETSIVTSGETISGGSASPK